MKTSELFEKEINYIKSEKLRKVVAEVLDIAPVCIQHIPASSTGKYHPTYSLGEGGLVRHVKAAVGIAHSIMDTDIFKEMVLGKYRDDRDINPTYRKDCVYAALILHDCFKPDDDENHRTRFDHPLIAAENFKRVAEAHHLGKWQTMLISEAIASHMGQWNTSSYAKGYLLPTPQTRLESFVHMCDYLASRKFLQFNFDEYEKCY